MAGFAGLLLSSARRLLGDQRHSRHLLRGSMLVMATQIAGIGLAYAMQVAVARTAGVFEFGLFAYAWTWMNLIFLVAAFGLNEAALRLLPTYASQGDWPKLRGLVMHGPLIVLGAAGIGALVATGAMQLLGDRVGEHYRLPLLLTFAAAPVIGLLAFLQGVGRALGGALLAFLPRTIGLPTLVLLAVAVMLAAGVVPVATTLVAVTVAAAAALALLQWLLLVRRALPPDARGVDAATPLRDWLRLALPCLFIAVCFGLLTHCDLLMVGFFHVGRRRRGLPGRVSNCGPDLVSAVRDERSCRPSHRAAARREEDGPVAADCNLGDAGGVLAVAAGGAAGNRCRAMDTGDLRPRFPRWAHRARHPGPRPPRQRRRRPGFLPDDDDWQPGRLCRRLGGNGGRSARRQLVPYPALGDRRRGAQYGAGHHRARHRPDRPCPAPPGN
ncbi:MAG: lipopolysaccharide biosynthesis protein [Rhodospirillales bacterium]|nr:lipopolysaccharide biosynthesis protein [Rhodospirillales bacterium]